MSELGVGTIRAGLRLGRYFFHPRNYSINICAELFGHPCVWIWETAPVVKQLAKRLDCLIQIALKLFGNLRADPISIAMRDMAVVFRAIHPVLLSSRCIAHVSPF